MTLEIAALLALLGVMVVLFLTEKIPVDLTAFAGLVVLIFAGYVTPAEAFAGFSSPAVITMLSIFVVSAGLLYTGVAAAVGRRLHGVVGAREVPLIVTLSLLAALLSAFMNNIAATAVLMPAVASLAARARISPSRLFMPLAFGAILGGTTTLVGTPPNILAGELLAERGLVPFALFDFTPIGLALLAAGTLYMATMGRWLLPARLPSGEAQNGAELARLYQVRDKLFMLRIPERSSLIGRSLGETRIGATLGVKVLSIDRRGAERQVPRAETLLAAGDRLLLHGRRQAVDELLTIQGLEAAPTRLGDLPRPATGIGGIRIRVPPASALVGRTLAEVAFRERFGLVVLALVRQGRLLRENLAEHVLLAEDELLGLGPREQVEAFSREGDLAVVEAGFASLRALADQLFLVRLPPGSPLVGVTLATGRVAERLGLTVAAIVRGDELRLSTSATDLTLQPDDRLLVVGEPARLGAVQELGGVEVETAGEEALEGSEIGLVEATVAPRSSCVGRTLRQLSFRDRFGMVVLSLWREGRPIHGDLADIPLRLGDGLLLQGRNRRIDQLAGEPDFVVLTQRAAAPSRSRRAPFALGGLGVMIALVVAGIQPIHVASFAAATLVLLTGAVRMQEAYRAIEWRAIFLVAAVLPVGAAMERTGAAALVADGVSGLARTHGPVALLAALVVLASLLSQSLDGAPTVVLLTPVLLEAAGSLSISPYPLMMGVALAASAAFMTPFSHKANLLVMGAGGYRSLDYARVGTPLTVVVLGLIVWLVPLFFPF